MKENSEIMEELIEKFLKGDESTFSDIYNLSVKKIYSYISTTLIDKNFMEDVIQETYIQIYKNLNQLKEPKAFLGWSGKIAVNIAIRYNKKLCSENEKKNQVSKKDNFEKIEKVNPETNVEVKEKQEVIREALNSLTDIKKIIVTDYYFNNMKVDEIAESLQMASGTVKNHLFQSRKTLKKKLIMFKESLDVLLLSWFAKEMEGFNINENDNFKEKIEALVKNNTLKESFINGTSYLASNGNNFLSHALSAIIPVTIAGGLITSVLIFNNKKQDQTYVDTFTAYITETSTEKNENDKKELKEDRDLLNEVEKSSDKVLGESDKKVINIISDEELKEKYPNLIIDIGEVLNVLTDANLQKDIENARQKLEEVYEEINNKEELDEDSIKLCLEKIDEAFNICYDIHSTISVDDGLKFENDEKANEFDEIFFKGIYLGIKLTESNKETRESFFIDTTDNIYISTAKRFNKYKGRYTFLYKYSQYITKELKDCFLKGEGFEKMNYASRLTGRIYKNNISNEEYTWANDNKKPSEVK